MSDQTSDFLIRTLHRPLSVRIVAAIATTVVRAAGERHRASAAATCALGRTLCSGVLLATLTKGGERVTVQILGDGPLQGVTVDTYDDGAVRGYALAPQAWAGRSMAGRQHLRDLVGRDGVVNVVRDLNLKERYQGQTRLTHGEIDEDIEAYLRDSEQIPSALGSEVVMDAAGQVLAAGGVLIQSMPDAPSATREQLKQAQHELRSGQLYELLARGAATPVDLARLVLGSHADELEVLDQRSLRFQCRCDRGRIEAMLLSLETRELDEMIAEGRAEITCNYCNKLYTLSQEELLHLRQQQPPREQN